MKDRRSAPARSGLVAAACLGLAFSSSTVVGAAPSLPAPSIATVVDFDDTLAPEGIAFTPDGSMYVTTSGGGEVWKIGAGGVPSVEAVLAPTVAAGSFGVLDIAADRDGRLYAAVASGVPATAGVWTWLPGEPPERIRGSEGLAFANFIAIAADGSVFVSESFKGQLWRAADWSGELELWSEHPWLKGNGSLLSPALPVGANGVAVQDRVVYVANTEEGSILRFPISADGTAGAPTVWTTDPRLVGIDGITIGPDGVIYAALLGSSQVARIGWDTRITPLASAVDGIDYNSDLAFGVGQYERSVFTVNFSVGELFGQTGGAGPGIVRIDGAAPLHTT